MQRRIEREAGGNAVERIPAQRCAIEGAVMFAVVHSIELRMAQIILNLRLTLRHRTCCTAANRQMGHPFTLRPGRRIGAVSPLQRILARLIAALR
jgi:hypothetical protein